MPFVLGDKVKRQYNSKLNKRIILSLLSNESASKPTAWYMIKYTNQLCEELEKNSIDRREYYIDLEYWVCNCSHETFNNYFTCRYLLKYYI